MSEVQFYVTPKMATQEQADRIRSAGQFTKGRRYPVLATKYLQGRQEFLIPDDRDEIIWIPDLYVLFGGMNDSLNTRLDCMAGILDTLCKRVSPPVVKKKPGPKPKAESEQKNTPTGE